MDRTLTAAELRENLFSVLDSVVTSDEHFIIATRNGNAVIIGESALDSLTETFYLLTDPTILDSVEEAERTHSEAADWRRCLEMCSDTPRTGTD